MATYCQLDEYMVVYREGCRLLEKLRNLTYKELYRSDIQELEQCIAIIDNTLYAMRALRVKIPYQKVIDTKYPVECREGIQTIISNIELCDELNVSPATLQRWIANIRSKLSSKEDVFNRIKQIYEIIYSNVERPLA